MEPDSNFDSYLRAQLDEASTPDNGFAHAITARIKRRRSQRRMAFACATIIAAVIVAIAEASSGADPFSAIAISPATVVAALSLAAVCSLVWIVTESRSPQRVAENRGR